MDPAKRICLKNLPEGCTKREIAELVRNRTGIQPHSIDLGLNVEKRTRSYAHFSCESTKNVLEILAGGITMRDRVIHAYPARPHYIYKYAEARRKRKRTEEQEEQERKEFWESYKKSSLARFPEDEPVIIKPPKTFYASRQKYATIAAEIAEKGRKTFHDAHPSRNVGASEINDYKNKNTNYHYIRNNNHNNISETNKDEIAPITTTTPEAIHDLNKGRNANAHSGRTKPPFAHSHSPRVIRKIRGESKGEGTNQTLANKVAKSLDVVPAVVPAPTKEERKLSSLQARLSSLGAKIYKKEEK